MKQYVPNQGLYDASFEHDACGIGMIANITGVQDHHVIDDALTMLENLSHRGASGADPVTGDGAGITVQISDNFFRKVVDFDLPENGSYAIANLFLHKYEEFRLKQLELFKEMIESVDLEFLGIRDVPVNTSIIGPTALSSMPYFAQVFIGKGTTKLDTKQFEYRLYVLRRKAEKLITPLGEDKGGTFYVCSCSSRTIVYKGMLTSHQLRPFFLDLLDLDFISAVALVHARFSTNTFPSWERAHPNRYSIHNGEINTIRGNVNWMKARQSALKNTEMPFFDELLPIIDETGSDSSMFDNVLEFLYITGRSLPHAMMMLIPEPWEKDTTMTPEKKAFYSFHHFLMEPWEGPAAMAFTDGSVVGATLDRNGLRPSRYYITKDKRVILSSEVGVLPVRPEDVTYKGRLMPGKMLVVDLEQKRIISDYEVKHELAAAFPYQEYVEKHLVTLDDFETSTGERPRPKVDLKTLQRAFNYTYEEINKIILPMASDSSESIGSMGMDTPLAVLSNKSQLLYNYFKQLFAQVTNPPLDGIRETNITSSTVMLGSVGNLLEPDTKSKYAMMLDGPILTNGQLKTIKEFQNEVFKTKTLSVLYHKDKGVQELKHTLKAINKEAKRAIKEGYNIFLLSDRGIDESHVAIPMLLAASSLHHFLIDQQIRTDVGIVVETAEAREIHHYATLFGYGVTAINPYLVFETLKDLTRKNYFGNDHYTNAKKRYIKASVKGIMKIISKMGISTLRSYHGSQLYEAIGIDSQVIDRYFTGTISRIEGISLEDIALETHMRHDEAFQSDRTQLQSGSTFQYKHDGLRHIYNPNTIYLMQQASIQNDYALFKQFSMEREKEHPINLRDLLTFDYNKNLSIPIEEVEPVEAILQRFKSGAMSYGSISPEAHETIAIAMNRIGGKSNSGEGGENPERYTTLDPNYNRSSAIKQIASGRFGVTNEYLLNAKELQIKVAQGAKPGEGGHLPGKKVYPHIAKVRHSTPGVGLISPPPHHDIYSIEDLAQLIYDLKMVNQDARINVKLVSEAGVGTVAAGVAKGKADVILVSGYDGGTGAAPLTSIQHAGLPWELGLAEVHQTLLLNKLRDRVTLETDGKLLTGRDVVIAAMLGAEEYGFATVPLVTMGCIMMRVCNQNTCPAGIATQDAELRKNFTGKPEYIVNYLTFVAEEVRELMARLGIRTMDELIGRKDKLKTNPDIEHWKARKVDLSSILYNPYTPSDVLSHKAIEQDHEIEQSLDYQVLTNMILPNLKQQKPSTYSFYIHNTDRVVGALIGSYVTKYLGSEVHEDLIDLRFIGSAGQSFGAFIPSGVKLHLEGDANDYIGKGLSGGTIVVTPEVTSTFSPHENIIIGNVAFYGATSGKAFIEGIAGERFAVRNSGANLIVEGVGNHACEYMTGGTVLILGETGKNIAAGMSGGVLFVYNLNETLLNTDLVEVNPLEQEDIDMIDELLHEHITVTNSALAQTIIEQPNYHNQFSKIIPVEFKRMISLIHQFQQEGHLEEEATRLAFELSQKEGYDE